GAADRGAAAPGTGGATLDLARLRPDDDALGHLALLVERELGRPDAGARALGVGPAPGRLLGRQRTEEHPGPALRADPAGDLVLALELQVVIVLTLRAHGHLGLLTVGGGESLPHSVAEIAPRRRIARARGPPGQTS